MPVVAAVALAEEIGRAGFPSPLLSTMASTFVLSACGTPQAMDALGTIAEGKATTLATTNQKGSWQSQDTDVLLHDGVLTGQAYFVQDARKCDQFLVSAQSDGGIALVLVQADAKGLTIAPDAIIDLTRDQLDCPLMALKEPLSQRLDKVAQHSTRRSLQDCVSFPLIWLDLANGYCKPPPNTPRLECSSIALLAFSRR